MSSDPTYLHAAFLKSCLDEKVSVPTGLAIDLLEKRIQEVKSEGKAWVLVRGFPESMEQLCDFEERVSGMNARKNSSYISRCKNQITRSF